MGFDRSRTLRAVLPAVLIAGVAHFAFLKTWICHWGAAETERIESLPGDSLVTHLDFMSTCAVTIRAPAAKVWPLLATIRPGGGELKPGGEISFYPPAPPLKVSPCPGQALCSAPPVPRAILRRRDRRRL